MTNPVAIVRRITNGSVMWDELAFICPGCVSASPRYSGLLMISVNSLARTPSWDWDGNLEAPTLSPSILTQNGPNLPSLALVCHSFLKAGVFQYLEDSTHSLSGQFVPMVPLEDWMLD